MTDNIDSTKYISEQQEHYIAKKFNGRVQPGSGNGRFKKTDVDLGKIVVEAKTAMTKKSVFSIKSEWLTKLKSEAFSMHKQHYALAFNFGGEPGNNYFVLDEQQFSHYLDLLRKEDKDE